MTALVHQYLSTACLHYRHLECREMCKFCAAPCKCLCHTQRGAHDDG